MNIRSSAHRPLLIVSTRFTRHYPSHVRCTAFQQRRSQSGEAVDSGRLDLENTPPIDDLLKLEGADLPDILGFTTVGKAVPPRKKEKEGKVKSQPIVDDPLQEQNKVTFDSIKASLEDWNTGWGKDEFKPVVDDDPSGLESFFQRNSNSKLRGKPPRNTNGTSDTPGSRFRIPFEQRPSALRFTRRIEGVIEPDKMSDPLQYIHPPRPQQPVAKLRYKLDRVLFNPGVHWLQDPRSRVYNFDPYLQEIPPVTDFAFDRLEGFTPSSKDPDVATLAQKENKLFRGSTSSLSGMLCHIYFLLSSDRLVNTITLSREFQTSSRTFTPGQRMPGSVLFNYKDGRYSIDSGGENGESSKNILTWLGTLLEKFMTMTKKEFGGYMRSNQDMPPPKTNTMREAFRFSKSRNFIMRSQLDCRDPRLPGTGVFDIKTRACVPIRMDIFNFEENSGYLIRSLHGRYESFEREYYDLIRSAFLKYQFQARIGSMDGVIVAYHNTKRLFGFQYVPVEEMDDRLFGPGEGIGDRVFKACLSILEFVAEEVVTCFPHQSVKVTFETLEGSGKLKIWVEPVMWEATKEGEERPIKQLEVRTWSYQDSKLAKPWEAFRETDVNWSVRWSIAHLNISMEDIRRELNGAKQRQFRAWTLPSGVDPEGLQEWYETLNFGGEPERNGTFNPERWTTKEDRGLALLRRLAREGRMETERIREMEEGKPRHVLGRDI